MCFSNLPIRFDDEGDPYLAEEADEVGKMPETESGSGTDGDNVELDEADSEELYAEILEMMPGSVRERVTSGIEDHSHLDHHELAEGERP